MLKFPTISLLLAISFAEADIILDGLILDHCSEHGESVTCENVNFSNEDLETNVVISNKTRVNINYGDIQILGDNFFRKFPKCINLQLTDVNIKFERLNEKWNIEQLIFEYCNITGVKDSNFFRSLPELSSVGLLNNVIDYGPLDKSLFGENPKIKEIGIAGEYFETINENVFDGLRNLENIVLIGWNATVPSKLFENKPHLKDINIGDNSLTKFPKDILPKGIARLHLGGNQIRNLSSEDFKGFKSAKTLKALSLDGNNIEKLDVGVFDELENLEYLRLSHNQLKNVSSKHFRNLKNLRVISALGSGLKKSDFRDLYNVRLEF